MLILMMFLGGGIVVNVFLFVVVMVILMETFVSFMYFNKVKMVLDFLDLDILLYVFNDKLIWDMLVVYFFWLVLIGWFF